MASLTEYDVQPILHGDGRDIKNKLSEIAYQYALQNAYTYADDMGLKSNLEKELAAKFIGARTGKVFATKIWHYDTNTSSAGEALLDSIGLTCTPATDTVQGQDDFADASDIFQWQRCNYTRDDDGFARPTALEGTPAFKRTGSVDIGNVYPTFWYKVENRGTYDIYYMSDSSHPELGLVPWYEACKADGTVLPFYVHSAFTPFGMRKELHPLPIRFFALSMERQRTTILTIRWSLTIRKRELVIGERDQKELCSVS